MSFTASVTCRTKSGGARKFIFASSLEDFFLRLDVFVRGEWVECPCGEYELVFIRGRDSFRVSLSENILPSQGLNGWERHVLEVLLTAEHTPIFDDSDYGGLPDGTPEPKEPWK